MPESPTPRRCTIGPVEIGPGRPLAVIAGPCTLESLDMGLAIGETVRDACAQLGLGYVFKASFDKANRTSVTSPRGPGMDEGLAHLATIRETLGVPVTTDIHDPAQAAPVAAVVDCLQIPAFLCRQSDLLAAAAEAATARQIAVNVKKGQFLSPAEMVGPVRKLSESGCENVLLTERGTFFGYHRLVNDFIGLGDLMELDCSAFAPTSRGPSEPAGPPAGSGRREEPAGGPAGSLAHARWSPPVCFDVTHSTQLPGSGTQTGGRPDRGPLLARAAVASGVHAVFIECHPDPSKAWSDGATQLRTEAMAGLLRTLTAVRGALA